VSGPERPKSAPRLRILFATPPAAAVGPIPRITAVLVRELRNLGAEVTVADWGSDPGQTTPLARATGRLKDMLAIWRQARSHDVAVIASAHYGNTIVRDVPLLLGLRAARLPAVLQFHGSRPEMLLDRGRPLFRLGSRLLLASASAIMVLSSEEKRAWEWFRPRTRAYVVKNPYVRSVVAPAGPTPAEPPVILFVGRLMASKGVLDLVEAVGLLAAGHPELPFRLVMAGDGPERSTVVALAEKLGVRDKVELAGHVDGDVLGALYGQAAIFVLPSHLEGFPTVIAEAMDAGLPIVTTAIRGALDYLDEGENALLVPPRQPARLADALATLLSDPALGARMGEQNRKKVDIFAPATVAAEYLDALRRVAGPAPAGG
jgi:glycosyltransferase involved in cell wall biosynthesis